MLLNKLKILAICIAVFICNSFLNTAGYADEGQIDIQKTEVKKVLVGDVEIGYRTFGEGYPLIMVMGYGLTMDYWQSQVIKSLSEHYKVILFDNRGMGYTSSSEKPFTIEQFADDAAGLLDALGIKEAHVLGWSMGTNISLELTLRHPDKVNKLILYAADCGGKELIQPSAEVVAAMTDTKGTEKERDLWTLKTLFPGKWMIDNPDPSKYFPMIKNNASTESIKAQWKAMDLWNGAYERLKQIAQPTLLITGTEDINTPWQNSLILIQKIPNAWLVQISGAGHGLMYQYPQKFAKVVLTFLE